MISFNSYLFLSFVATIVSIINAYTIHEQFYSTVIFLTTSKINRVVLLNFSFSFLLAIIIGLVSFFFGDIRESEKLSILEKLKRKVFDFFLIVLVFREDSLDVIFFVLFLSLISLSILHWLTIKRAEYLIEESQGTARSHLKILFFYSTLISLDVLILLKFYNESTSKLIITLFAFEFFILWIKSLLPLIKYLINLLEIATFSNFESKITVFSGLDFVFTSAKLIIQLLLFNFIRKSFGLPLHLISDTIETIYSLFSTLKKFANSCYLNYKLNQLESIKAEEMAIDRTCVFCFTEMDEGKKISCGHVFHLNCLKRWIHANTSQICPKCNAPIRIGDYVEENESEGEGDEKKEEDSINNKIELKNDKYITKTFQELELLESITSYDSILKKKEQFFKNPNAYEEIEKLDEKIRKSEMKFKFADNVDMKRNFLKVGSLPFGLPREAVAVRTWEIEVTRKKITLMNLLWESGEKNGININITTDIQTKIENKFESSNLEKRKIELENIVKKQPENLNIDLPIPVTKESKEIDENELRRRKTLEAFEKRTSSLNENNN